MIVHYNNDTELDIYAQFDDAGDTRVQFTEGTGDTLRRYLITDQDLIDALLPAGVYRVSIRQGLAASPTDTDYIYDAIEFPWNGTVEIDPSISQGSDLVTLTITDNVSNPIPDARVWVTTTTDSKAIYDGPKRTDSNGEVQFLLEDGNTFYLWMQAAGYVSITGQSFVAVAD